MRIDLNRIISACAAIAISVGAHATSLNVGYCMGEIADEGLSKIGNATIEGAVVLSEEMLAPYVGATVTGVRVGLVTSDGVENLQGWIRNTLEGDNLDMSASTETVTGWNEIALNGGQLLTGEPLVAGFSFSQQKAVKCISVVGENNDDARWIAKNGQWELAKNKGVLSIELVITSDNLPERDLEIVSFTTSSLPAFKDDDMSFNLVVRNRALTPFSRFDVEYKLGESGPIVKHCDAVLNYGDVASVDFSISPEGHIIDAPLNLCVTVLGENDDVPDNNTINQYVGWYSNNVERRVLIEEFTTERCPNCPRAINTLHQCENAGYGERMSIVAHHVGFYTDWLTLEEDENYLWLYDPTGTEGSYAPAVMLDRTVLEGETVPVNTIGYFSDFEPVLKKAIEVPAFVALDVASGIDDNDNLNVTVTMSRLPIFDVVSKDAKITVYIVEDGIPHHNQAGISSDSFTHSHVNRACLTDIWGDPIEWAENNAVKQCSLPLDESWNRDNLSVVAFVNDYDPMDVSACRVHNSAVARVGGSGIDLPVISDSIEDSYYSLSGLKIDNPVNGIYLHRVVLENGSVRFEKVYKK